MKPGIALIATMAACPRELLFEQLGSSIPVPFLMVLVFRLTIIFANFGLFALRNGTVITAFFVCALSVSGAIFRILELDRSFEGPQHPAAHYARAARPSEECRY